MSINLIQPLQITSARQSQQCIHLIMDVVNKSLCTCPVVVAEKTFTPNSMSLPGYAHNGFTVPQPATIITPRRRLHRVVSKKIKSLPFNRSFNHLQAWRSQRLFEFLLNHCLILSLLAVIEPLHLPEVARELVLQSTQDRTSHEEEMPELRLCFFWFCNLPAGREFTRKLQVTGK